MTEESDIRYFEQMDQQPPLVLFDGYCNLCDWSVRFLIRHEKHEVLRFASVESQIGRAVLRRFGLPLSDLESFVLIEGGHHHTKSAALFQVARYLGPPWQILRLGRFLPRPITDSLYGWVARNRYRLFGKKPSCAIFSSEISKRFLR
jgi:predicted DCC family thiol-disulfide oxidoreductase YuxK